MLRRALVAVNVSIFAILILSGPPTFGQAWANQPAIEQRINGLLKQMTLEEKIGQLNQYSAGSPTGPGTGRGNYAEMIAKGEVGSLFNVTGQELVEYQKISVGKSRLKIPLLFGLDVIHGYRTTFPTPLGMSATWNPELVEKAARVAAIESAADGIRWTFSPMVDISRDARWGRTVEGSGEDPFLGAVMARAYVRGYQGTSLTDPTSIAACAKHYVAYGAAEAGRDYNSTEISDRTLRAVYLPPFHAAEKEGVATFMSAFNALNGVPASANRFTLRDILRDEWKFRGLVVSDWTSVNELIPHGIANDGATAARRALLAGVDMDMESNLYHTTLAEQVKSGKVPLAVVDEAVRRVLRVKFALGLFENPYPKLDATAMLAPGSVALARTIAEESFVLLKNDKILPLKPQSKIALIGPLADDAQNMLGAWSGRGEAKDVVTLRTALQGQLKSSLVYAKGTEILTDSENGFAEAVAAAQQSDVVVMALGENAGEMTGEAASRAYLGLPGNQEKLLSTITAVGKPVVLIIFSGRPLVLDWPAKHVGAILEAWHPGIQGGPALVRTLYGANNPSGKLTVSFPRSVGQEPLYYDHLNTGRPLGDVDDSRPPKDGDEKYHSRYIDEENAPLYPFGFGLSYSNFTYSAPKTSAKTIKVADLLSGRTTLKVSAEVRNNSDVEGAEVTELYIRQRGTSVALPVRELKGFQKVVLKPGDAREVEFTLDREQLSFWNVDMKFTVEPAALDVWITGSSAEGTPAEVSITE